MNRNRIIGGLFLTSAVFRLLFAIVHVGATSHPVPHIDPSVYTHVEIPTYTIYDPMCDLRVPMIGPHGEFTYPPCDTQDGS